MTVSGAGPPQQPPPAADPDDEGPTRGVGRLVLRFLLAIGPLVVVLGVVAAGDQRRWPVIADAAVADGTGLRIVEPEPGAVPTPRTRWSASDPTASNASACPSQEALRRWDRSPDRPGVGWR